MKYTLLSFLLIICSCQGPKGDRGDPGIQGKQGIQGIAGKNGINGARGEPGEDCDMTWFQEEMGLLELANTQIRNELSGISEQLKSWPIDSLRWFYQQICAMRDRLSRVEQISDSIKTWPSHVEGIMVETIYAPEDSAKIIEVDSVAIHWNHDWLDIAGNSEQVCYFETSYLIEGVYAPLGKTKADAQTFRPPCRFVYHNLPIGKKIAPIVRAVDTSANRSAWHSSLSDGWYIKRIK